MTAAPQAGRVIAGTLNRRAVVMIALALVVALAAPAAPAFARHLPVTECASIPGNRGGDLATPCPSGPGLSVQQRSQVFSATSYQTMAVAGLVGSAIAVGALAGGVHTALIAGTAVLVAYMFMP